MESTSRSAAREYYVRLLIGTVVVIALLVAACGGSSSESQDGMRDFSEVQVGETEIQILERGTAAVIRLTTDPATVCAIGFGETEDLGRIANDPAMGGSAIEEHAVVLSDLQPDTTYSYRFTATDAAGNVYQTAELMTFTTEVPELDATTAAAGTNVAVDGTVLETSSEWSEMFAGPNVLDGDVASEWSSAGDGNDAYITVDLGRVVDVVGVAFRSREMADGTGITSEFSIQVDRGESFGPFPAGDRVTSNMTTVEFTAQMLRFDVDESTGGNTGAVEIEVYAAD